MDTKHKRIGTAFIEQMARVDWQEYPGHFGGALSKALVGPENSGSKLIDFRISRYAPNAYVQEHVHKVQEQIYYVLEGEGVLTLNDDKHLMRPHDYVYVPPGVRHSFTNTGLGGLVFLVVTAPADDVPLEQSLIREEHHDSREGQGRGLFAGMTAAENLALVRLARPTDGRTGTVCSEEKIFQYFPRLKERMNVAADYLSGGEQETAAVAWVL